MNTKGWSLLKHWELARAWAAAGLVALFLLLGGAEGSRAAVSFNAGSLSGHGVQNPTSLQFGPDGRLYVAEQKGLIWAFTLQRDDVADYSILTSETISILHTIPNHNDDGALAPAVTDRQVTGILVRGTASNPVIFVASSDPRIKYNNTSPPAETHDTNSGILSRLTWNGTSWEKLDLVRGLPRSEENHASNGLAIDEATNTIYLMSGGHTNSGAPSAFFGELPEYGLSAALLTIDLDAIGESTYDLPTLDDEDRPGTVDSNDPFGGNEGKNQAILDPDGPVQVYSPGWRNAYDVLIDSQGRIYTVDNGPNGGYGGFPDVDCSNALVPGGASYLDGLHLISGPGYYGGHPNPTRGSMSNTFNPSNPQSPVASENPTECVFEAPGSNGAMALFSSSTNGIAEYTASNFSGEMQGDLLVVSYNGVVSRIELNAAGDELAAPVSSLFSGFGVNPLDVVALSDSDIFPGTVWVAVYGSNAISVFEPGDYGGVEIPGCEGSDDDGLDEDSDGYSNADEIDNGTSPCSAGSIPPDHDLDFVSDLNDPDDDNDSLLDNADPFALDPANGASTDLPVFLTWNNGEPPRGGLLNMGFTGLMQNGSDYASLWDPDKIIPGGAPGVCTIIEVTDGDALEALNSQDFGLQLGINVDETSTPFVAQVRLIGPFSDVTPEDWMSMGLFFGTGDQDHYLKLAAVANGGVGGIEVGIEEDGIYTGSVFGPGDGVDIFSAGVVDLFWEIDPQGEVATAKVEIGATSVELATLPFPMAWLQGTSRPAVGLLSTWRGASSAFSATWDDLFIYDTASAPTEVLYRVNAGGPTLATGNGGPNWSGDLPSSPSTFVNGAEAGNNNFVTTASIDMSDPNIPPGTPMEMFQSERWDDSPSPEMVWSFPVPPGNYAIRLYFAENYLSFNNREFGLKIEGQPQGTVAPFLMAGGKNIGTVGFYAATVLDGSLTVEFLHISDNSLVQGIEILGATGGANLIPILINPGNQSSTVGDSIALQLVATDGDGDPITYGATGLPPGLTVDPVTGLITGDVTTAGTYDVTATATDDIDTDTQLFSWTVSAPGNQPPVLTNPGAQSSTVGDSITLQLVATDGDGDPITYGATGLPPGLTLNPVTGLITGDVTTAGTYDVTATATDDIDTDTQLFSWSVSAPGNQPPVLSNPGAQSSTVGDSITLQLVATDGDGDPITYGATGLPPGLTLDPVTGLITGDVTTAGTYGVTATATDDIDTDTEVFSWTVLPTGGATTVLYRVNAGGPLVSSTDGGPDWGDDRGVNPSPYYAAPGNLTYAISRSIDLSHPSIPPGTPELVLKSERYDPPPGIEMAWSFPVAPGTYEVRLYFSEIWHTSAGQRVFDVSVEGIGLAAGLDVWQEVGRDAGLMLSATRSVVDGSLDVNMQRIIENPMVKALEILEFSGTGNQPPVLTNPGSQSSTVGDSITLQLVATDGDGDPITYGATGLPPGLTVDPVTGLITGDVTTAGTYDVTATATDDIDTDTEVFSWTVSAPGNQPPVLTNPGAQSSTVGDSITLQLVATDGDGDPITYGATGLPPSLTLDPVTGLITGDVTTAGTYDVTATATDDIDTDTEFFSWTVSAPGNQPPVLTNPGAQSSTVGDSITLQLVATDGDGDPITYGATGLLPGLTLNPVTGLITGDVTTAGTYDVTATATDDIDTDTQLFSWTVSAPGNQPPLLTNPGAQSSTVGDSITLQLVATDGDGDPITYGATGLPPGLTLNPVTGLITGDVTTAGTYDVTATATDDIDTDTQLFSWSVSAPGNQPPVLSNPGAQSSTVGDSITLQLVATDGDGDPITYGATGLPPGLTLDPVTGLITGDVTTAGTYGVTATATDDIDTDTEVFSWTVLPTGGATTVLYRVNAGGPLVSSTDGGPDWGDDRGVNPSPYYAAPGNLTYAISRSIDLSHPSIPPGTPELVLKSERYDPPPGIEMAWSFPVAPGTYEVRLYFSEIWHTSAGQRVFDVSVEGIGLAAGLDVWQEVGRDAGLMLSATRSVVDGSLDVNMQRIIENPMVKALEILEFSGTGNQPPVLTNPGSQSSTVGDSITLQLVATDGDGDPITYGATGLPPGLTVDPVTGLITGDVTTAGTYDVTATATDDIDTDTEVFSWTVSAPGNQPPVLTNPGAQSSTVGDSITLQLVATDGDGDPITYGATGLPPSLTLDPVTGLITGDVTTAGTYDVTATATDDIDTDTELFSWTVSAPGNQPPVLTNPGAQSSTVGDSITLQLVATDGDGDPITYGATGLPPSLTLDPVTGLITGDVTTAGTYDVTATATDDIDTDTQLFSWTVSAPGNQPPLLTNPGAQSSTVGDSITLQLVATDGDGDPITYGATGLPPGLTLNPVTGLITGDVTTAGTYDVTATATDDIDTDTQLFSWSVSAPGNQPPVLSNPGAQSSTVGDSITLQLVATDGDGDPITYGATGLPPGLTLDPVTGLITGDVTTAGTYGVTATATDDIDTDTEVFSWTVLPTGGATTVLYRVNAGGPLVSSTDGGPDWGDDRGVNPSPYYAAPGNLTYAISRSIDLSHPSIPPGTPELVLKSERYDPPPGIEMAWSFPVAPGTYEVRLYFSEIWHTSAGQRVFDVSVEGIGLAAGLDVWQEVGRDAGLMLSATRSVVDGSLDVNMQRIIENPMVKALEILEFSGTGNQPPVLTNPGSQSSTVGDSITLQLVATDGDGDPITYGATGLPPGLTVDPVTGLITGDVTTAGTYDVTATATDDIDTATQFFSWTVSLATTEQWQILESSDGSSPHARHETSFVESGGIFYLLGGRGIKPVNAFDPASETWSNLSAPPIELNHFQAVEVGGLIYVVSAFTGVFPVETPVANIYIYDPASDQWSVGDTIPVSRRRGSAGAVVLNGKILIVGGLQNGHQSGWVPWFDEYDPSTGQWTTLPDAPRSRDHFHAAIVGDQLVLAGGRNTGLTSVFADTIEEVDVYDLTTNQWSTLAVTIPTERAGASSVAVGNEVWVIGGESGSMSQAHAETEALDPVAGTWRVVDDLVEDRHGTQAIVYQGRVFIAAGSGAQGGSPELSSMETLLLSQP